MTISVQKEVAGVCIMSIDYDAPGVKLAVLLARHDANAAAFERGRKPQAHGYEQWGGLRWQPRHRALENAFDLTFGLTPAPVVAI